MLIAVWANDDQWKEITACSTAVEWKRMAAANDFITHAAASFILEENKAVDFNTNEGTVFFNAVDSTLDELNLSGNTIRINGWNGFLQNKHWEMAGQLSERIKEVLRLLDKQFTVLPDEPGFISARIISMIINEAYFALGEEVSTKNEIDIAMKLGTNYPHGPFEWANIIGLKNIYTLLKKMSVTDPRYLPAPLLEKEATTA